MDETPAKETPPAEEGLNKIDLSQLQDFRFGTQWTEIKPVPGSRREGEGERGPRREGPGRGDRRPREGDSSDARRDRRSFRRPAGAPGAGGPEGAGRPGGEQRPAGEPRGSEGFRGGRPMAREGGGERRWAGPHGRPEFRPPYVSAIFNVAFYPEDAGFGALAKAMRGSCRTYELFEIARLILGKPDRFVIVLTRKAPGAAPETPAPAPAATPAPAAGPIFMAIPDGLPFETEEAAVAHVVGRHFEQFFDLAVVDVDPPKGNFPFVNRCTLSGELLGPPNYHRYQQILQQHHAARFPRMPFEEFRDRIETVRDPAVVEQWLEKMKKATRYTWKLGAAGEAPVVFDSLEEARAHAVAAARDRMVKAVETARFHGKLIEALPAGEIRRAIEGHFERQRRFPLDTANALRGRLRREGFTIFKKGAKGISYVCAVKRKFRVPGQVFAEGIGALIAFIEANPMISSKELPQKLLGITPPSTPSTPPLAIAAQTAPAEPAAPAAPASAEASAESAPPAAPAPAPAAPTEPPLPPEQQEKLRRLTMDLRWLVQEGYVTEFGDGRLFTPPPMAEQRAKAAASGEEEHDPVAFPEVPAAPEAQPADGSAPAEPPAPSDSSVPADMTMPPMDLSAAPVPPPEPAADAPGASEEPAPSPEPPAAEPPAPSVDLPPS